jgi:hypothetical protein
VPGVLPGHRQLHVGPPLACRSRATQPLVGNHRVDHEAVVGLIHSRHKPNLCSCTTPKARPWCRGRGVSRQAVREAVTAGEVPEHLTCACVCLCVVS